MASVASTCVSSPGVVFPSATTASTATVSSPLSVRTAGKRKREDTRDDDDDVSQGISKKYKSKEPHFDDVYTWDGSHLGSGGFGFVIPCVHRQTGQRVAVKVVKVSKLSSHQRVLREIQLASLFRTCPTIVDVVEYFEEDDHCYTVYKRMEGGDLADFLREHGPLSLSDASKVCSDVAYALYEMHMKGIAHRDVKPANILCERSMSPSPARLADFDRASKVPANQERCWNKPEPMTEPCGTALYLAPEMVGCYRKVQGACYTIKADLWSLGVTLYRLVFDERPFTRCCPVHRRKQDQTCRACQDALYDQIQEGSWSFPDDCDFYVSDAAKDIISRLLVVDPAQRMSARDVLLHPFVTSSC